MRKFILSALLSLAFLGLSSEASEADAQRYGCSSQRYYRQDYNSHYRGHSRYDGYYSRRYERPRYYRSSRHHRHYEAPRRYYRRSYSSCGPRYGVSIRF